MLSYNQLDFKKGIGSDEDRCLQYRFRHSKWWSWFLNDAERRCHVHVLSATHGEDNLSCAVILMLAEYILLFLRLQCVWSSNVSDLHDGFVWRI